MSTITKVRCLHYNRFWLAGSESIVSLACSFKIIYYCRQQLIPLHLSLIKTPIPCKNAIDYFLFVLFFVLRNCLFYKWDMLIVLCISFQNAFFCACDKETVVQRSNLKTYFCRSALDDVSFRKLDLLLKET